MTLTPMQAGWLTALARARVKKARRRTANVLETDGETWYHGQLARSLAAMEAALEELEAMMEDVDEESARWEP